MVCQSGFSETNRIRLAIVEEAQFGVTPTSTPLTGTFDAVATSSTFESDTSGSGPSFASIQVDDVIEVDGFTSAGNNGIFRVTAVDTTTTTHTVTVDATLTDESGDGDESLTPPLEVEEAPYTQEPAGQSISTQVSNEVRADAQVPDVILTGVTASGGYSGELTYGVPAFEKLLQATIRNADGFATPPAAVTGEIAAVATGNQFTADPANGVDFSTAGVSGNSLAIGDWVRMSGFDDDANNGYFQITAIDTTVTPQTMTVVGDTLVDEAAAAGRSVQGSAYIRNGVCAQSFTQFKQYLDVNNGTEIRITGFKPSGVQMTFNPQSIMTFQIAGQGVQAEDTRRQALVDPDISNYEFALLSRPIDAPANEKMTTVDGVGEFIINRDSPIQGVTFQSLSANPTQSLRNQQAISDAGVYGPSGIGQGRLNVSGSATAYFEAGALPLLSFGTFDLALVTRDRSNNAYLFDFPAIKPNGDQIPKGTGIDQDSQITFDWTGFRSTRYGLDYTIGVHKFAA